MVKTSCHNNITTIVLSPNRSTDWKEVKLWLIFLSLPALVVALGWFFAGVWIILPFAGLELALLSYFMYRVCYQNYRQQYITIKPDSVIFSSGIGKPEKEHTFDKQDCFLAVTQPSKPIENLKLELKSETESLTIGEFLNPEERELARRSIRQAGIIECSNHWWARQH